MGGGGWQASIEGGHGLQRQNVLQVEQGAGLRMRQIFPERQS